jgi:predicted transposase YbfD/YdcC
MSKDQLPSRPFRYCPLMSRNKSSGFRSSGCVESQRQVGDKMTSERRYYLLSLPLDAASFATAVRSHWGIENQLHWIFDMGFREDQSRTTQGDSGENLAVIRHLAVNLLSQEKSAKGGTQAKRLKAGWDDQYLTKVLSQVQNPSRKS